MSETENPIRDAVCSQYDIGAALSCERYAVGLVNHTYVIQTENRRYALTEFLHKSLREVAARADVLLQLRNLPVAPPVPSRSGDHVIEINNHPALLSPWLEGTSAVGEQHHTKKLLSRQQHLEVIDHFRSLHTQLKDIAAHRGDMADFSSGAVEDVEAEAAKTVQALIEECRDCYQKIGLPADTHIDLVHGDFERQNLLFTDEKLSGILDFDALKAGNILYEWAHCTFNHACCDPTPSEETLRLYVDAMPLHAVGTDARMRLLALMAQFCEDDLRGFAWLSQHRDIELDPLVEHYRAAFAFAKQHIAPA